MARDSHKAGGPSDKCVCVCMCVLVAQFSSDQFSSSVVSDSLQPHGLQPTRLLCPWHSSGKNTGVGCHSLLRGEEYELH